MIYLDNSATTIPDSSVLKSFEQVNQKYFANPSSLHRLGGEAEQLLMQARRQIAELMQVKSEEIIFTSGGTEGNNLAIKGIALRHQNRGKHMITTTIEHPSVYETFQALESLGFEVTYIDVDCNGVVDVDALKKAIRDDTILMSVMHVNNELGSIQPIQAIGEIAKNYPKLYFHVDDVQGFGKIPISYREWGIDLCTISGHKIHGLKGTGLLFTRENIDLFPLFHGGNQENKLRSGTENLAGIVSLARAVRLMKEDEMKKKEHLLALNRKLRKELAKIDEVTINSPEDGAPHILNISVPRLKPEVIIHKLSEENIYISTRSACSSKEVEKSRILEACGFEEAIAKSALRISLSYQTTMEEINVFTETLAKVLRQLLM